MKAPTNQRQHLIEIVSTLLEETLTELANFVDYLAYKLNQYSRGATVRVSILE
jgi:hypothetical protein